MEFNKSDGHMVAMNDDGTEEVIKVNDEHREKFKDLDFEATQYQVSCNAVNSA